MKVKAKYFTADTQQAAEKLACDYFGCGIENLVVDIIKGGGDSGEPFTIVAFHGDKQGIANMHAFYKLHYEPDGVYLEIYGPRGGGKAVDSEDLIRYIKRKNVTGVSVSAVQMLAELGAGRDKVAPPQQEYKFGEDLAVTISNDEREASIRLLEPEEGGALLTIDEAKGLLTAAGVLHGIDNEALEKCLNAKIYGEPFVVAKATDAKDGADGKLIFHFSTEERTGRPKEIDPSGRVDFRSLDLYVAVTEGQLLVSRVPASDGESGITVRGTELRAKPGKDVTLPRGKNITYNEDRTEIYSACSGMVEYINNALNVSNVYNVKGDCDISVGNIDFEGSVHITGSVRSGHTIKATDGISVGGNVEGATLIAGGNIEIKGGMLGVDKGHIEAGGAVTIMFVERGKILADGPIKVDVAIHSTLETASTIQALGKRGAIIGGSASAAGDIIANFIGALSNTKTSVRVGFMPRKRARLEHLEQNAVKLKNDQMKLTQLEAYLAKTKDTLDKATWEKLHVSGIENKRINDEIMAEEKAEIERLMFEMEHATDNKVHVFETAFGGSRVTIGASSFNVTSDIGFATFKYSNGEVVYGPCEKSKTDYK